MYSFIDINYSLEEFHAQVKKKKNGAARVFLNVETNKVTATTTK